MQVPQLGMLHLFQGIFNTHHGSRILRSRYMITATLE